MAFYSINGTAGSSNPAQITQTSTHTSGALTVNASLGHTAEVTLNGNVSAITVSNMESDDVVVIYLKANTLARTITFSTLPTIQGLTNPGVVTLAANAIYRCVWSRVFNTVYLVDAQILGIVPAIPDVPVITATAGNTQVTVSWPEPNANGAPITGYTLEWSSNGFTSVLGTATPLATDDERVVTGLTNGTTYSFRLRATNAIGTSANSTVVTSSPFAVTTPAIRVAGGLANGGSISASAVTGDVIVIAAVALAASSGTVTIGAPAGWTEIGTEFNTTGFRSDQRWFRKTAVGGAETITVTNANRIHYWVIQNSATTFTREAGSDGYAGGAPMTWATVTAPAAGVHLISGAAHSDSGSTGTVTIPATYTQSSNTTPAYHGTIAGHKAVSSGVISALTSTVAGGSVNWSTSSVVVTP